MASGLAWLSLFAQVNALLSACSSTRRRPTSKVNPFYGQKRRKRSPFSNRSEEVMVEVLLRVRTGKYGANVFYRVFSFLCYSPTEKVESPPFPLIKLQVTLGFDVVVPLSLLVSPKNARDERMKITAFTDAGEDECQSWFIKRS
ncbi:hypothetical protein M9H77_11484 [Catharanthus roseus]|uniref:Uncharacterized protein n=1 Tax=Catharanthus roseus TaxID=4058 RepID=A0ACC0BEM0_CATRO|nr:hypothetical protein M9H77_11484 [Catharanthus roseus]